jgi:urease accessory protein
MILERVVSHLSKLDLGARTVERIRLESGDLAKHRQRARTDQGREIGIALPPGPGLKDGDVLYLDDVRAIVVEQADEDLLRMAPRTPEEFARIGYEVGNLHRAAMIDETGVAVLYDKAVRAAAERLGIPCEQVRGKFRPVEHSGHSH